MDIGFKIYFTDKTVYVSKNSLKGETSGNTTVYKTSVEGVDVEWQFKKHMCGTLITLEVCSQKPLGIKRIDSAVFSVGTPQKTDRIAFVGRDMQTNETRYPWELAAKQEYCTDCLGHFEHLAAKGTVIAGVSPFENIYASVAYKNDDGSFDFCSKTEYTEGMLDYTSLKTECAFLCQNTSMDELFDAFRPLLPQSSFPMPKLTGWNSWDYYLDKVTAEDIAENAAALKNMPFADMLDYIVIDDGWQKGWGEWTENEKFVCGLKAVADSIKDAGFIPGIWMTPVGIKKDVALFDEHPEWLCKNEMGELLYDMGLYYLDPTNPDAEKFILDNYRYQYDCGYRLFKMDYVSPLLKVKSFYDKDATAYSALARLVRRVQECTGPDAVVLGCSLPLECGADIAPSMRIGVDIHNFFTHVSWIAQSLEWSWMFNNKITRIDPDFLVVRGDETSDDPDIRARYGRNDYAPPPRYKQTDRDRMKSRWCHGDMFNAVEAETWANLVSLSGGNIFLSDRISRLNPLGVSIIQNALRLTGNEARPCYQQSDNRLASLWKGDNAFVIINWEDVPRSITVSGIDAKFVSDKPYTINGDTVTVSLLPHESFAAVYK